MLPSCFCELNMSWTPGQSAAARRRRSPTEPWPGSSNGLRAVGRLVETPLILPLVNTTSASLSAAQRKCLMSKEQQLPCFTATERVGWELFSSEAAGCSQPVVMATSWHGGGVACEFLKFRRFSLVNLRERKFQNLVTRITKLLHEDTLTWPLSTKVWSVHPWLSNCLYQMWRSMKKGERRGEERRGEEGRGGEGRERRGEERRGEEGERERRGGEGRRGEGEERRGEERRGEERRGEERRGGEESRGGEGRRGRGRGEERRGEERRGEEGRRERRGRGEEDSSSIFWF